MSSAGAPSTNVIAPPWMAYVTSATANNVRCYAAMRARVLIVSLLAAIFFQPPPPSLHARGIRRARRSVLSLGKRERERERGKLAILAFPSFLQPSSRLPIEFRILQSGSIWSTLWLAPLAARFFNWRFVIAVARHCGKLILPISCLALCSECPFTRIVDPGLSFSCLCSAFDWRPFRLQQEKQNCITTSAHCVPGASSVARATADRVFLLASVIAVSREWSPRLKASLETFEVAWVSVWNAFLHIPTYSGKRSRRVLED